MFYADQTELVSYFLSGSNWIEIQKGPILKFRQNNYFGLIRFLKEGQVSFIITMFTGAQSVLWVLSTQLSRSLRAAVAAALAA